MTDYQDALVLENLDLVNWVIRTRISIPNRPLLTYDDFYAIGCEAICRAALKYQPDMGAFAPFACRYIYNAIVDHCRAMNYRLERSVEISEDENASLLDNLRLRAINCYLECIGKEKWKLPFVRVQQKAFLENVISEADYEYFKSCLKNDDEMFWYFVIRFLAATGARVSELIQIKVEHVKLGHLDLYSKGGKLRRIYIPKELQNEALSWLAEKRQESGFIFLNKYGERITTRGISGQLKKLAMKYGINPVVVYPHSFRHRFAKSFLDRCNDIAFLADLMGHESIETTRIYLRKTATEQREIVDTIVDW